MKDIVVHIIVLMSLLLTSCAGESVSNNTEEKRNFAPLTDDSVLVVATLSRSTSYYTLRDGHEMGFEYELGKELAQKTGKTLKILVAKDMQGLVSMLDSGARIIAYPLSIEGMYKKDVEWSEKEFITHQVIVQRKGRAMKDVLDLIGRKVTVSFGSKYHHRLLNLNDEIGGGLEIQTVGNEINEDQLIRKVSEGEIDMTVTDNDIARVARQYYRNIDIKLEISHPQRGAWAVAKGDSAALRIVNDFFVTEEETVNKLRRKYFETEVVNVRSDIPTFIDKYRISVWDENMKTASAGTVWDWRLLSALAYTESRFNPDAGSFAGAKGLMQLLPETMIRLGGNKETMLRPDENIRLAVLYLNRTYKMIQSARTDVDRKKLTLAAYNAGLGHIRDAQRLCEMHGDNPADWSVLERYIRMLASPDYYNLPGIKCGYLRGDETADYVNKIWSLYQFYKKKFPTKQKK